MQEAVKSKFEQTILGNLTPDGKLLDLENKNIGPEELRLLCDADEFSSDLASVEQLFLSQNQLCVWKYPSMAKMAELTGHTARVLHMAQSPDGHTIVSAAADETLRFWRCFDTNMSKSAKAKAEKKTTMTQCIR